MSETEPIALSNEHGHLWRVGRYVVYGELAVGGAGSIHVGRAAGPGGFVRVIVLKRLHPHLANDPEHVAMFLDEVRLTSRIRHLNVVSPIDVVIEKGEPFMVMEYIEGVALAELLSLSPMERDGVPVNVIANIMVDVLHGLHAAHVAVSEQGEPLGIVHRDVSPSNIMVGCDGIARILDFGIAKAESRACVTAEGQIKGKLGYMAPEQLSGSAVDCRADVFAAGIVFWEALTRSRLFQSGTEAETAGRTVTMLIPTPSSRNPNVSEELDEVVLRALCREPEDRYETAEEFAQAIERCIAVGSARAVSKWVQQTGKTVLDGRVKLLEEIERSLDDCERLPEEEVLLPSVSVIAPIPPIPPSRTFHNTTLQPATVTLGPNSSRAPGMGQSWYSMLAACIGITVAALAIFATRQPPAVEASAVSPPYMAQSLPETRPVIELEPVLATGSVLEAEAEADAIDEVAPIIDLDALETTTVKSAKNRIAPRAKRTSANPKYNRRLKPAARRRDCSRPYTVDAEGIRRIKPYCL